MCTAEEQPMGDAAAANGHSSGKDATSMSALIESLLFVADEPVAVGDLARALEVDRRVVDRALDQLAASCGVRGVRLQRTNGRVQMVTAPEAAEAIQRFLGLEASARLSRAALEVLAIVSYRQPVTRPEIDTVRGVNSEASLRTLMARGLVEPVGRRETVGHPIEYATTFLFLEYFGLAGLHELPPIEAFAETGGAAAHEVAATGPDPAAVGGVGDV